jgi:hypothetical protein
VSAAQRHRASDGADVIEINKRNLAPDERWGVRIVRLRGSHIL